MSQKNKRQGIVFSTDPDFKYQYAENEEPQTLICSKQLLRIELDKKQRAGKKVTMITGFIGSTAALGELAKMLKTFCGVGGSAKENTIVIQGDHRQKINELLLKKGYKTKLIMGG